MAADDGMRPMEILLVEDSQSDAELAGQALRDGQVKCQLTHLTDGSSAVQFLLRQGRYSSACAAGPDPVGLEFAWHRRPGRPAHDRDGCDVDDHPGRDHDGLNTT